MAKARVHWFNKIHWQLRIKCCMYVKDIEPLNDNPGIIDMENLWIKNETATLIFIRANM